MKCQSNMIIHGNVIDKLQELEAESVQCVVTSPPYWGLRDYGRDNQLGLEKTPEEYIEKMVEVFRGIKRVLRKDGTSWLNLGDSYGNEKQLTGIPWRVALALQSDGWYLRQDIIWHKPNPMPESVTDRCTKSHEYIFLLTKSSKYFYDADAIREEMKEVTKQRYKYGWNGNTDVGSIKPSHNGIGSYLGSDKSKESIEMGRNKRSVWSITTKSYKEAHFATFPPELPELCIKAGTSEYGECSECGKSWKRIVDKKYIGKTGEFHRNDNDILEGFTRRPTTDCKYEYKTKGWDPSCDCNAKSIPQIVLDPFFGSGTTGWIAQRLGRRWIGIELNSDYIKIANKRFDQQDLFNEMSEVQKS